MRAVGRLGSFRRHAESRMGSTNGGSDCRVWRLTDLDADNRSQVHEGPMRLAPGGSGAAPSRTVSTPGGEVALAARRADFPEATPDLLDGDLIEITAGRSAGSWWHVVEADRADQQTAYRVPVVAAPPPPQEVP